jgi:hypothetical protein
MAQMKALPEFINGFRIVEDLGMGIRLNCKYRLRYCIAICKKCNNPFEVSTDNLKTSNIGCSRKCAFGKSGNRRLHKIFGLMKERCYSPAHKSYPNYGIKGITICDEWLQNSESFYQWALANGYSDGLSIDRINNDKGYSPDNCRWADKSIQSQNSKQAKLNENDIREIRRLYKSEYATDIAKKFGVSISLIYGILNGKRWKNIT